ncbi:MAG: MBL fold metallo-hydrolase, partial [Eubacterium sp.]|nr:MBL fold metallo-hydrolase [Eubacterium sp.]
MNKSVKIIGSVLITASVIAGAVAGTYIVKPNLDYKKLKGSVEVKPASNAEGSKDRIHFLSTGSSDAILIESDGKFALVDCAEDNDNPRGFEELEAEGYEERVLEYLKANAMGDDGKVTLDFVLGTHSHSDHIGGFDTIINDDDIVVKRAYLKVYKAEEINDYEVERWDNQEVYDQMMDALNSKNVPVISEMDGTPFALGNFTITLFNTYDDNSAGKVGENDNSLGVLIEKNGTKIFLSGDINNVSGDEERMAPQIGKINLLKVGHHSYSGSTSKPWLRTLAPDICIVTNNYESIDFRTVRRITRVAEAPTFITGEENGIIAVIGDSGQIDLY